MSAPELLDQAVEALRLEHGDGSDGGLDADATRSRIRHSLEASATMRARIIATVIVVGVLGTGSVSWAYLSGRLHGVWTWVVGSAGPEPTPRPRQARAASRSSSAAASASAAAAPSAPAVALAPELVASPPAGVATVASAPSSSTSVLAAPSSAQAAASRPRPRGHSPAVDAPPAADRAEVAATPASQPAPAPPDEASDLAPLAGPTPDLYRAAHQLHFHGGAPAAALAAWDAYLAGQPTGRFAVEARYNRAIALVRLRRYPEAAAALAPFADGAVAPKGYRQAEAQRLRQRLGAASSSPATPAPASESSR
jgi:hypothetical protein